MSEYAACIYLMGSDIELGVRLLEKAGLVGYVLPPVNGWVTLLPEGDLEEAYTAMLAHNTRQLLLYEHAEDHGLKLSLADGMHIECACECLWDPIIEVLDEDLHIEKFCELLNQNKFKPHEYQCDALKAILYPTEETLVDDENAVPGHRFGRWLLLNSSCFVNLSYDNLNSLDDELERGMVFVED